MILSLFVFSCLVCPVAFFHYLCFNACILNCNKSICLRLLGWYTPCYILTISMFCALGLWQYSPICSNKSKDKYEDGGLKIPPHIMETYPVNTCQQDTVAICGEDAVMGMMRRHNIPTRLYKSKDMDSQGEK